jgi:general stress protein 26
MTRREAIERLWELIGDIDFTMLTTHEADGTLRSRPMSTQQTEFDGDLWFLTSLETTKVPEIEANPQVNLSYARPDKQRYVSVSGTAHIIDDRAKLEELWSPIYKVYFPEGKDDPSLRLIRVVVEQAEFWEGPNGLIPTLVGFAKALSGQPDELGENEKIQLKRQTTARS